MFCPICLPIFCNRITLFFFFLKGTKWKTKKEVNTVSLNPAVLSSFLSVLVRALNLQSPATAPLGLLPKKYVSSFLSPPRFPLELVSGTMWKEVRDKVAGPSFAPAVYLLCQGLRDYTVSTR